MIYQIIRWALLHAHACSAEKHVNFTINFWPGLVRHISASPSSILPAQMPSRAHKSSFGTAITSRNNYRIMIIDASKVNAAPPRHLIISLFMRLMEIMLYSFQYLLIFRLCTQGWGRRRFLPRGLIPSPMLASHACGVPSDYLLIRATPSLSAAWKAIISKRNRWFIAISSVTDAIEEMISL